MGLGLEMKNYASVLGWRFNCGGAIITANTVVGSLAQLLRILKLKVCVNGIHEAALP